MAIPLPVLPGVFRTTLNWTTVAGQHAANVIHLQDASTGAVAQDVFNAFQATGTAAMWTTVSNQASITGLQIILLNGTAPTVTFPAPTPVTSFTGGATGDHIPAAATLVKLSTGLRGRANRGRIFLPFMGEAGQQNGTLAPNEAGPMTTAWTTWMTAMSTHTPHGFNLVVASYDRAHNGAGAHSEPVETLTVESVLATQRRRQQRLR